MKVSFRIKDKEYECDVEVDESLAKDLEDYLRHLEIRAKNLDGIQDDILYQLIIELAYNLAYTYVSLELEGGDYEKVENNPEYR
ncbi:MAG: hypothetical protein ABIL16_01610 [candidate division WOR-3 bacterium]